MSFKRLIFNGLLFSILSCCDLQVDEFDEDEVPDNAIKIGLLATLTGDLASVGFWMESNGKLAQKQINENGGILGQPVKVLVKDTHFFNLDATATATRALINEGVIAIVGPLTSSETLAIAPIVTEANVLLLTTTATSPEITGLEDNGTVNRIGRSDTYGGTIIGHLIDDDGHISLGIVYVDDDYGQGLHAEITNRFSGDILSAAAFDTGINSYHQVIQTLFKNGVPDAILIIAIAADAATVTRDIAAYFNDNNITQLPSFYGSSTLIEQTFLDNANPVVATGLKITQAEPGPPEPSELFEETMREVLSLDEDVEPVNVVYDAFWMIAYALMEGDSKGQGINRQTVLDNLHSVTNADDSAIETIEILPNELGKMRAALQAGQDISFVSTDGPITLDDNGDMIGGISLVYEVQLIGGSLEYVAIREISL